MFNNLTKTQLVEKLGLPSVRTVDRLVKTNQIPFERISYHTILFNVDCVRRALKKVGYKPRKPRAKSVKK